MMRTRGEDNEIFDLALTRQTATVKGNPKHLFLIYAHQQVACCWIHDAEIIRNDPCRAPNNPCTMKTNRGQRANTSNADNVQNRLYRFG